MVECATSVTKNGTLTEQYTYGANGERLSDLSGKVYQYDVEDHMLLAGDTAYVYNTDGFLTAKYEHAGQPDQAVTAYEYSSRGELICVILPGGKKVEYEYDPMGRRVVKKVNGTVAEKYLWLGLTELLAVYDGAGNYKYRLNGPAMIKGIYNYYLVTDQVGTVRAVVYSNGNVAKRLDYDAFGNVLYDSAPAFTIPITFAGGLYDNDTKLIHFHFRDYDPETGRWTAKDPIGFTDDTNLYGYCLDDPINLVDPEGLLIYEDFLYYGANFSAGMGDVISFGLTRYARKLTGANDVVDPCSGWYMGGEAAGIAHGLITGYGGIMKGGAQSLRTLFYDPRRFGSISGAFWRGGAAGRHLHHWLIPGRWEWVPAGIRNAGWNLVPITGQFNRWMGFAPNWIGHPVQGAAAVIAERGMAFFISGSLASPATAMAGKIR